MLLEQKIYKYMFLFWEELEGGGGRVWAKKQQKKLHNSSNLDAPICPITKLIIQLPLEH